MFNKKSIDAEGEKEKKNNKKPKKPKPTAQEKALKNKQKVERKAAAKIRAAEAKIKKAEQAEKNKVKASEKKIKNAEKKEEKLLQKEIDREKKKEENKEKKAAKKIRDREKKIEQKALKLQRKAELAARTPLQKKIDRRRKMRKFLAFLLMIVLLAGAVFGLYKFGPKLIKKLPLPDIQFSQVIDGAKEKIPFLSKDKDKDKEDSKDEDASAKDKEDKGKDSKDTGEDEEEAPPVEEDPTLSIAGGSLLEDFYTEALAKFMKMKKGEVAEFITVSEKNDSYSGLINGDTQVIFASLPGDKERKQAALAGVDLHPVPIINGGLVFFTNKNNTVKNLTESQLYNIYAGNITNWKDVGGPNKEIVPYQRKSNIGAQSGMYNYVISENEIQKIPEEMKIDSTKDIIKAVAEDEGAIGFSYYYYIEKEKSSKKVKLLPINSIKPDRNTIATSKYPLTTYTYAVVTTEENTKSLEDIITSVDEKLAAKKAEMAAKAEAEAAANEEGETEAAGKAEEATSAEDESTENEELPLKLKFIKWILSDEGQKLVEKYGFIKHEK